MIANGKKGKGIFSLNTQRPDVRDSIFHLLTPVELSGEILDTGGAENSGVGNSGL